MALVVGSVFSASWTILKNRLPSAAVTWLHRFSCNPGTFLIPASSSARSFCRMCHSCCYAAKIGVQQTQDAMACCLVRHADQITHCHRMRSTCQPIGTNISNISPSIT
eukprot:2128583-Amphidinium_carterae.1